MADNFDTVVGKVAGAIYGDIAGRFSAPPMMLIPPVTFKVRKVLEHVTDVRYLSPEQKRELAGEIEMAIIPMLFSYELDAGEIAEMAPLISSAAFKTLLEERL